MNNRVNYTMVGFFVLLGTALMLGVAYWMLKPSNDNETKLYNIYFDESVLGLNLDAPVKYRGIDVGKVTHLNISKFNSEQVQVEVTILKSTPIKENTVARLTAQGITGLTYINLSMGDRDAPPLRTKDGEKYPTIKTVPSFFENIEQSFGGLSLQLSNTLDKTDKLLNAKNQEEFSKILKNTANMSAKIDRLLDDATISHLQNASANLDSLTYKFDKVIPNVDHLVDKSIKWQDDISRSFNSIMTSYLGIKSSMTEIKRAVSSGEFNIKEITADVVPTMNNTFLEMENFIIKLDSVLEEYKNSPSDILYKKEAVKKAPGEK